MKVYWIQQGFEVERDSLSKKNINIYSYQITNLLKMWFLVLVSKKEEKRVKNQFVTKFVGIIVMIVLI